MAVHFYRLPVKDIRKETEQCVSICFDIPPDLSEVFTYRAGQNITIRYDTPEGVIRRSYSICSSPRDSEFRIAVKHLEGGIFSTYANTLLQTGDTLEVLAPTGSFTTAVDPGASRHYCFFAAGSGITPVISLIKTLLIEEPKSQVTLFYGNRSVSSIIFKEQLEALKNRYMSRFSLTYILSGEQTGSLLQQGRIDAAKCRVLATLHDFKGADAFFLCGPEGMIFTIRDFLEAMGVPPNKIHFELFTTPAQKTTVPFHPAKEPPAEGYAITVRADGLSHTFHLKDLRNNLLDAALEAGLDLPFSCKGGVCCTCKSKLLEGRVEMQSNYGLEPEELEAGFILTCQSHPLTQKVVIDFDARC